MISEQLISGEMSINVKPPVGRDGVIIVLASDAIGVSLVLTSAQANTLLAQLQHRLIETPERELLHA